VIVTTDLIVSEAQVLGSVDVLMLSAGEQRRIHVNQSVLLSIPVVLKERERAGDLASYQVRVVVLEDPCDSRCDVNSALDALLCRPESDEREIVLAPEAEDDELGIFEDSEGGNGLSERSRPRIDAALVEDDGLVAG
jgi:hypothetical protein